MSTHRARHGADRDGSAYRPTAGPDSVETAGEDAAMDFEVTLEARPTARPVTTPPGSGPPGTTLPRIERLPPQTGALHGRDLHYARAGRTILDGVWMSAQPGQSLAIMGPSGSGKSSLLALLAGLERPDSGEIVRDPPVGRVGLVLQGYGLVSLLTAAENVEVPLQAGAGPTGGGSASKRLTPAQIQQRAGGLLAAVGLAEVADHLTEQLSGGQQQRVAIARALAVEPDVVLADELTAELDHEWKHRVLDVVLDVARRGGVVVLATHDPDVAARCDRVIHLDSGHVHPDNPPL